MERKRLHCKDLGLSHASLSLSPVRKTSSGLSTLSHMVRADRLSTPQEVEADRGSSLLLTPPPPPLPLSLFLEKRHLLVQTHTHTHTRTGQECVSLAAASEAPDARGRK